MRIIKIEPFENGAHANQTINGVIDLPDGWAVIPDDMELPSTFPFVNVVAGEVTHFREVEILKEVTKTRQSESVDAAGKPITVTEEYTEPEFVTEQQPYTVVTVTGMTEGVVPEPEPEPEPEPSELERLRADIDYIAMETGVEL